LAVILSAAKDLSYDPSPQSLQRVGHPARGHPQAPLATHKPATEARSPCLLSSLPLSPVLS
ncbi:MAG: hypothetical protein WAK78_05120, partial [Candidatus Acidiferrales bacterium]